MHREWIKDVLSQVVRELLGTHYLDYSRRDCIVGVVIVELMTRFCG
jgi:hypothetical protein